MTEIRSSARFNSAAKFDSNEGDVAEFDMDCRGTRGGIQEVNIFRANRANDFNDNDQFGAQWTCMDGTTDSGGQAFTSESVPLVSY